MKKRRLKPWARVALACIKLATAAVAVFVLLVAGMVYNNDCVDSRYAAMAVEVYSHE